MQGDNQKLNGKVGFEKEGFMLWEMAAVLRELLFQWTKMLQNTQIAKAKLTCYEKDIEFIYIRYDVDLRHVVPKMFQNYVRMCVRMT
jgi:hypothetical protein